MVNVGDIRECMAANGIESVGGDAEREFEEFRVLSALGEYLYFRLYYDDTAEGLVEALSKYSEGFKPELHAKLRAITREDWYDFLLKDAEAIKRTLIIAANGANSVLDYDAEPDDAFSFEVAVKDGDVFINGEFVSQLCWEPESVGCAIAEWLGRERRDAEGFISCDCAWM